MGLDHSGSSPSMFISVHTTILINFLLECPLRARFLFQSKINILACSKRLLAVSNLPSSKIENSFFPQSLSFSETIAFTTLYPSLLPSPSDFCSNSTFSYIKKKSGSGVVAYYLSITLHATYSTLASNSQINLPLS